MIVTDFRFFFFLVNLLGLSFTVPVMPGVWAVATEPTANTVNTATAAIRNLRKLGSSSGVFD